MILQVRNLNVFFHSHLHAVRGISFDLEEGEIFGIVGESGSGKTVACHAIARLLPKEARVDGDLFLDGKNTKIGIIFQDPMTSLNPTMKIGKQIRENMPKHSEKEAVYDLLMQVGIKDGQERFNQYPHQLSGGLRQRVMIAIALAANPKIIIADEPTTSLDATIQMQILNLLKEIKEKRNTSIILISHDLTLIGSMCQRIAVMYGGKIVEISENKTFLHPYAQLLLKAAPSIDKPVHQKLYAIEGSPPNLYNLPKGCAFSPRCPFAKAICFEKEPSMIDGVACFLC